MIKSTNKNCIINIFLIKIINYVCIELLLKIFKNKEMLGKKILINNYSKPKKGNLILNK